MYGEPLALFRPVIEHESVENAFLKENPLHAAYTSDSKPWLIGITSDEAAAYVGSKYFILSNRNTALGFHTKQK